MRKFLAAIFLLFLAACSRERGPSQQRAQASPLEGIGTSIVQPISVHDYFEAVGTVRSRKTAVLSSKAIGTIIAVLVREGDRVKKGQALAEIDSRDLRAELEAAEASLDEVTRTIKAAESAVKAAQGQRELAAATFKRYKSLMARGSVTPQEYDEVSAKYKVATAEVERAEESLRALEAKREQAKAKVAYTKSLLSYTHIISPFDGIVTEKKGEVGILALPGTPLLTVEDTTQYRLEALVGESWIFHIRIGNPVSVSVDAAGQDLSGTVVEIVPAADPQSRTFTVKIDLPAHPNIRSGLYGKARFSMGQKEVLLAPLEAIVERGQLVGLYVVDTDGIARFRLVKTGKRHGDRVEILSGLKAGERVVTRGVERVSDGSRLLS